MRRDGNALHHAEMLVLADALALRGSERLEDCDLWVTLEPCTMCAGAIAHARIRRLYFAARDEKAGAVEWVSVSSTARHAIIIPKSMAGCPSRGSGPAEGILRTAPLGQAQPAAMSRRQNPPGQSMPSTAA